MKKNVIKSTLFNQVKNNIIPIFFNDLFHLFFHLLFNTKIKHKGKLRNKKFLSVPQLALP